MLAVEQLVVWICLRPWKVEPYDCPTCLQWTVQPGFSRSRLGRKISGYLGRTMCWHSLYSAECFRNKMLVTWSMWWSPDVLQVEKAARISAWAVTAWTRSLEGSLCAIWCTGLLNTSPNDLCRFPFFGEECAAALVPLGVRLFFLPSAAICKAVGNLN